ncbi:MAG: hypothetical protein JSS53_02935, partial [Proteobacteria bacterium]|nr:hypothetical protein [Pseudomonadota bacterium]
MMNHLDQSHIRTSLLSQRNLIDPVTQKNASQAVYQQVIHSSIFVRSKHIAFYMAI